MRILLALIALLVPVAAQAQTQTPAACPPLKQLAAIKLERMASSWAVPVFIDGVAKHMILSPSLGVTFVTPQAVAELKLPETRKRNPLLPIPGATLDYARVKSLVLATGQFTDNEFMVLPMSAPAAGDTQVAGALGLDILTRIDFDIDMASMTLNLFSQDHCDGQVVYWKTDVAVAVPVSYEIMGQLRVPVMLDGVALQASISLGTEANRAALGAIKTKLKFDEKTAEPLADEPAITGQNAIKVYRHTFKTLEIGGLQIQNPAIELRGTGIPAGNAVRRGSVPVGGVVYQMNIPEPVDLVIGMATLSKLRFYLAGKERKLYISPAVAPAAAP